ncbi:MAG: hypothetical protein AB1742_07985, partial [bacterium]
EKGRFGQFLCDNIGLSTYFPIPSYISSDLPKRPCKCQYFRSRSRGQGRLFPIHVYLDSTHSISGRTSILLDRPAPGNSLKIRADGCGYGQAGAELSGTGRLQKRRGIADAGPVIPHTGRRIWIEHPFGIIIAAIEKETAWHCVLEGIAPRVKPDESR